jgi:DNA polymerase III epsilon subunit-like protein
MKHHTLAFVDLETTGLNPLRHEIIDIGVVRAKQGRDVAGRPTLTYLDELEIALLPQHIERADPKSLEVNQYHKRDWSHAVAPKQGLEALVAYLNGSVFIAQNVTADWSFILVACEQYGVPLDDVVHYHKLDLASMAFGAYYEESALYKYSLRELSVYFDVKNKHAHTALSDARTTYEIAERILTKKNPHIRVEGEVIQ